MPPTMPTEIAAEKARAKEKEMEKVKKNILRMTRHLEVDLEMI